MEDTRLLIRKTFKKELETPPPATIGGSTDSVPSQWPADDFTVDILGEASKDFTNSVVESTCKSGQKFNSMVCFPHVSDTKLTISGRQYSGNKGNICRIVNGQYTCGSMATLRVLSAHSGLPDLGLVDNLVMPSTFPFHSRHAL